VKERTAVEPEYSSDVAFTPTVKAIQAQRGSRRAYARLEARGGWQADMPPELTEFIAAQRSFFLATANLEGQPYMQHRGGPPGFLRVMGARTLAFADYAGNRQYITLGNLRDNPRAQLFLIDYADQRRVKIWGTARVEEEDSLLLARLMPEGYRARPEQAIVFEVSAWDENCPQHIPRRYEAANVEVALTRRDARIAELEREVRELRAVTSAASAHTGRTPR
jgi:predicted pyridoxine 5'-phosphate oxidase superfamily flavin-nucleotide-binding protein